MNPRRISKLLLLAICLSLTSACGTFEIGIEPTPTPAAAAVRPLVVAASPSTPVVTRESHPTDPPTLPALLAATSTMTPTPLGSALPKPAVTYSPTAHVIEPRVLSFTLAPTTTLTWGEHLSLAWAAIGSGAELCTLDDAGPLECQAVPLNGHLTLVTGEQQPAYSGLGLHVTTTQSMTWSIVNINLPCRGEYGWFFENPPAQCPAGAPLQSSAAAQYFEHGFMLWIKDTDTFYVFQRGPDEYGAQTFQQSSGLRLKSGASVDNRVGEEPPPGYSEPVSGFGLVWRGEVDWPEQDNVRQRLGWAIGSEFGFEASYQCAVPTYTSSLHSFWNCYLRGPKGEVLHLHPDSTAQVKLIWEER